MKIKKNPLSKETREYAARSALKLMKMKDNIYKEFAENIGYYYEYKDGKKDYVGLNDFSSKQKSKIEMREIFAESFSMKYRLENLCRVQVMIDKEIGKHQINSCAGDFGAEKL